MPADGAGGGLSRVVLVIDDAKRAMGLAGRDRRGLLAHSRAMIFDQDDDLHRAAANRADSFVHRATSSLCPARALRSRASIVAIFSSVSTSGISGSPAPLCPATISRANPSASIRYWLTGGNSISSTAARRPPP